MQHLTNRFSWIYTDLPASGLMAKGGQGMHTRMYQRVPTRTNAYHLPITVKLDSMEELS